MMKRLLGCAAFFLLSCSGNDSAGTTSETENEIAIHIVMPNGFPAAQVRLSLVDATHFDALLAEGASPRIDLAQTDSQGFATVSCPASAQCHLLAQTNGYAALLHNLASDSLVTLAAAGSLSGTATPGAQIILDGTDLKTTADSLGNYTLDNVPQGYFALLLQTEGAISFAGTASVGAASTVVKSFSGEGLLLEDFEDGDGLPSLTAFGAGGAWYLYDDMAGTSFTPAGVDTQISLAISSTDAWQGNSLGLQILLDSNSTSPYGTLACPLGPKGGQGRADLSQLDSITLWIKGSGQLRLFFASDYIHTNYPSTQAGADLGYTFQAPSQWTRISIPTDSLLAPIGSEPRQDGVSWLQVSASIDLLGIGSWDSAGHTVELQVDDIRLHGVSYTIFR